PEGKTKIATMFWKAIAAGWKPPRGFDTASAFGEAAAPKVFDRLVDDIEENGGNPKQTANLINQVMSLDCSAIQRGILLAALSRQLKDAGLLTKAMTRQLDGHRPPAPAGTYAKNDTENATMFLDTNYPGGTICCSQGVWYTYLGQAWEAVDDEAITHQFALAMAPSLPSDSRVNSALSMAKKLATVPGRKIGDIPADLVLYQNGVLRLSTGELLPHSMGLFTTNIVPYNYNPQA
ncbi:unnamed protein product, partial [marine sediment metagenome]